MTRYSSPQSACGYRDSPHIVRLRRARKARTRATPSGSPSVAWARAWSGESPRFGPLHDGMTEHGCVNAARTDVVDADALGGEPGFESEKEAVRRPCSTRRPWGPSHTGARGEEQDHAAAGLGRAGERTAALTQKKVPLRLTSSTSL